ncbi:M56 family metallopeptidase [Halpernia sp. GG3]
METLILYFGKMILCSGVMFGYYFVFLKDKTFHHYNRFYLLSILFLSIFLPLIKIDYFTIEVNPDLFLLLKNLKTVQPQNFVQNDFNIYPFIFTAFGLVSVFFILKFLFGLIKIQRLKSQFPKTEFEGINFYETPLEDAPFSFFRNLFWKDSIELQSDLGRQILKHEMVHIEQKHTWDKIIITSVNSIFWFNPVFYLIKKEIILIHEYLADKKTVKQSNTKAFAQMLLASHFVGTSLPATSPFLSSNLKKRIIMLKKSHTKFSYLRKISALPVIFLLAFAYLVNAKNREIKQTNEVIEKAVSEIKKDTIKNEVNANLVEIKDYGSATSTFPLDENLKNSTDKDIFKIKGKKVTKAVFLKFYNFNKLNTENVFSFNDRHSKTLPNEFNIDNISKFPKMKKANEYYNSPEFKNHIRDSILALRKNSQNDLGNINSVTVNNNDKDFEKDLDKLEKLRTSLKDKFGKNDKLTELKIRRTFPDGQSYEVKINPDKYKSESDKVKAETNVLSKTVATETPNSSTILNQYNPGVVKVVVRQKTLSQDKTINYYLDGKLIDAPTFKKILPKDIKAINVTKNPGQKNGGSIYIVTKDSPLEFIPTQFDRIYINGKAATQNELFKLNKDSIKTRNINKNTENGKSFNEISIRTK